MAGWQGFLIGLGVLAVLAPLAAWLGLKHGRRVRGTAGLALVLLGLGAIIDPPRRPPAETVENEREKGSKPAGDPPDD